MCIVEVMRESFSKSFRWKGILGRENVTGKEMYCLEVGYAGKQ
jgi:hypothetical protein